MYKNDYVYVCDTLLDISHVVAEHFVKLAQDSVLKSGGFYIALSGGNTPRLFYSLLASKPYVDRVPWDKVYVYQTDERFVPFAHDDNNFAMLKNTLIDDVSLINSNVFRMQTENIEPYKSAEIYEKILKDTLPKSKNGMPTFDYVLLGVGSDGHIASLFPDSEVFGVPDKLVIDVYVKSLQAWRISLSFLLLNQTKTTIILVSGKSKAHVVKAGLNINNFNSYPVQNLKLKNKIKWYLDKDAALYLKLNQIKLVKNLKVSKI